jgi:mitofilin
VQNLNELITKKSNNLERLENIKSTIESIRQSAPNNQFITTILSTLNETLVERGVWTEPDLKQRYENVDNICRKLALIDERGASLVKYFISYIQSFFIFSTINKHKKLTDDLCLDADSLKDTFVILDLAKAYLDQNNFEMAIRLLNRLSGEPKRLASEWINEAIHLVEIKNACDLMNAYISSVYISSNFTN